MHKDSVFHLSYMVPSVVSRTVFSFQFQYSEKFSDEAGSGTATLDDFFHTHTHTHTLYKKVKFSHTGNLPSVGPGADPGVPAVSPQVT